MESHLPHLFSLKRRIATRDRRSSNLEKHDFLLQLGATSIVSRWNDFHFIPKSILDLGSYDGLTGQLLSPSLQPLRYIQSDISTRMLTASRLHHTYRVCADESLLPFAPNSFDFIFSNLTLHWIDDLPGTLTQIRHCLQKEGLFLATLFGSETLRELRQTILLCENNLYGRTTNRICPFTDVKTAGMLMQRAGFSHPVADSDLITIDYPNVSKLLEDIRHSAQANIMTSSSLPFTPKLLESVEQHYIEHYASDDGGIRATFELLNLTGTGR